MKLEITFKDGRKETFDNVESLNVTEEQTANQEYYTFEVAQTPSEGKLFEITPLEIDRSIFEKPRKGWMQENTRQIIQNAFARIDKYPEKYASSFYTLMPEKKWNGCKTVKELKEYAKDLGGMMADWVEKSLEWAQRIFNGESWETICNNADTANWFQMIVWMNKYTRIVGGSHNCDIAFDADYDYTSCSASEVSDYDCYDNYSFPNIVPLVVIKKKVILPTVVRF